MFLVIIGNDIRLGFHPHDLFFVTLKKWLLKQPFSRQKTKSFHPIGKNNNNIKLLNAKIANKCQFFY